jgi:hypothetical protein
VARLLRGETLTSTVRQGGGYEIVFHITPQMVDAVLMQLFRMDLREFVAAGGWQTAGWTKDELVRRIARGAPRDPQEVLNRIWRERCGTIDPAERQKVHQAAQTSGFPIKTLVQLWEVCDGDWNQIRRALPRLDCFWVE